MSLALLDGHVRQIWNIQVVCQDIFPLVAEINKEKRLFGTTINAYGAHIQAEAERMLISAFSHLY
jgi:hypothetical protein